jgi:uncharacterized membrane protein
MKQSIENYVPQSSLQKQRRQAGFAWSAIFLVSFIWMFSIVSAPIANAQGFVALANSIYTFFGYLCHQIDWRSYHIGEYPLAVCARCFGFYGGFLLGIIIYPFARALHNTEPLTRKWLFLAMIPMGFDLSLTFFGVWENTHLSRLLSGAILGAACAFFIIPALVEIGYFIGEKLQKS